MRILSDDIDRHIKIPVSRIDALFRRSGRKLHIANMGLRNMIHPHATSNARKKKHVLRLKIGCIAEAINLKRNGILSGFCVLGNIETRRIAA